uniref:Salivary kazal-type proteinase inhibitor n=1 Tax=Triatoma infestans TaxID=30076 RepID=A6YPK0_TRIIF|nr:salivary kazal-type proteinase inhibitor [Triatoma infestans]
MKMKLSTSTFSVVVIAVFLTVCMFDFGEAGNCPKTCTVTNQHVCGQRVNELRTFNSLCEMEKENLCGSGGWTKLKNGHCST